MRLCVVNSKQMPHIFQFRYLLCEGLDKENKQDVHSSSSMDFKNLKMLALDLLYLGQNTILDSILF